MNEYPYNWPDLAIEIKNDAEWKCIRCNHPHDPKRGYTLTVHHFDGDKANCEWWNLMALCQRCHLTIQARVNPDQDIFPFMPISDWMKPYVAGRRAAQHLLPQDYETVMNHLERYLAL